MRRDAIWWLIGVVWLAAIGGGLWAWERYDTAAGADQPAAPAPTEPGPPRWRLTVFVHPHCPCARATVGELAEVIRQAPELAVRIIFVRPASSGAGWERGRLWDAAAELPGAELVCDPAGKEAREFGAETSGLVALTDPTGRAVFRGGITRGRGREGDSAGRRAVVNLIAGRAGAADAPVYGCPLFSDD